MTCELVRRSGKPFAFVMIEQTALRHLLFGMSTLQNHRLQLRYFTSVSMACDTESRDERRICTHNK